MFGSTVCPRLILPSEARKAHPLICGDVRSGVYASACIGRATPHFHTLVPVTGYSSYRFSTFVLIEARDEWQFLKEFDVSLAEDTVEVIVDGAGLTVSSPSRV